MLSTHAADVAWESHPLSLPITTHLLEEKQSSPMNDVLWEGAAPMVIHVPIESRRTISFEDIVDAEAMT
jgi:hypothetical protein